MKTTSTMTMWCALLVAAAPSTANCEILTTQLCGPKTRLKLEATGEDSSVTVFLNITNTKRLCKMRVSAPESHYINIQWHDANRELFENHQPSRHPHCMLGIFLPDNNDTAVWSGDPCQRSSLNEVDLLTPELTLEWSPPRFAFHVREKTLVLTAVGVGEFCHSPEQHTCMRIGRRPAMCVSNLLVCDGNLNCPKGSSTSDEDEMLCKSHLLGHSSWQQLAEDVIRKLPPGMINDNWLASRRDDGASDSSSSLQLLNSVNWKDLGNFDGLHTTPLTPYPQPSLAGSYRNGNNQNNRGGGDVSEDSGGGSTLSHYGPWGYIMLGMLICGMVLLFCGLWECCFRKPKGQIHQNQHHQPTTVLIINRSQDEGGVGGLQPPNYDDLDQPPSYLTLFPDLKETDEEGEVDNENTPTDQERRQTSSSISSSSTASPPLQQEVTATTSSQTVVIETQSSIVTSV